MQDLGAITAQILRKIPGGAEAVKGITLEQYQQMKVDSYNAQEGRPVRTVNGEIPLWFSCYDCPDCKNKGTVAYLRDGWYAQRECGCVSIRKARIRAIHSGLESYLEKRLSGFETQEPWQKDALNLAKAFLSDSNPRRWIAMLGQSGAGKTHLCAAICNRFIAKGMDVLYFSWLTDGQRMMASRFDDAASTAQRERLRKAQVVYIDDLLKTKDGASVTPTELKTARELLDLRSGKITLVSSEFLAEDLANIDESLAGRLLEYCGQYLCQIEKDMRRNYRLYMDRQGG